MRIFLFLLGLFHISLGSANIDDLRSAANTAASAGEIPQAIAKFRELLEKAPEDGGAHYRLGTMLMDHTGDLDNATTHFEQAAASGFQPMGVAYRLGRIYGRQGKDAKSLEQLEKLGAGGFGMINLIEGEADFQNLVENSRYQIALDQIRASRFPCEADPLHRAFDFWLGDWTVTQNGQLAGKSNITSILGGCTIFEQWESAAGGLGKSFNYYDPAHDHWRQIWIGDSGTFIEFTGEARDGGIYYTAETIDPANRTVTHHKFQFTQNEDGSVRQYWRTSPDKSEWTTIWDGHYVKN